MLPFDMAIKVEEYLREDDSSPYKKWFDSLPSLAAAKVTVAKLRMELGNTSSIKWFDGMGEYVIDLGARLPDIPCQRGSHVDHSFWRWHQAGPAT